MAINCLTERGNRTTALRSDSRRSRQRTGMAVLGRFRPLSGPDFDAGECLLLANNGLFQAVRWRSALPPIADIVGARTAGAQKADIGCLLNPRKRT